jgi:hypothetical protein
MIAIIDLFEYLPFAARQRLPRQRRSFRRDKPAGNSDNLRNNTDERRHARNHKTPR